MPARIALDLKTGFLESASDSFVTFSAAEKVRAIQMAEEMVARGEMPRVSYICKALDVDIDTFTRHRRMDPLLKKEWERVIDLMEEKIVGVMVARGQQANGFMDRIAWLRAYRPHRWNPDRQIQLQADIRVTQNIVEGINGKNDAIEAEIVPNSEENS
ncbi:MAG TPA: hypothetical protein VF974_08145 [Patescibacteria group bacterium]